MSKFQGAWPALATPFTGDGEVHTAVLRQVVEYLLTKGIGGLYVCGSTGEGILMAVDERKQVLETVLDKAAGRVPVIAHVGCVSVRDATTLARHAQAAGADGVASIIPPLYTDKDSIFDYYAAIANAAPDLPFFAYIFGGPTDAVGLVRSLMRIPTLIGGKYTGPDMHEFRQIVDLGASHANPDDWTVFSGMDEECLFATMFGSSGNIGSSLNYAPGAYREMRELCQRSEMTRATDLQLQANEVTRILVAFGYMGALKEAMCMLGFDYGQPRLPNRPLPSGERESLRSQLAAAKFFDLAEM